MAYFPHFTDFCRLAAGVELVPVYRQLLSDTLTPLTAFARLEGGEHGFLFESVVGGERVGRYSFLGTEPFLEIEAYGNDVRLTGSLDSPSISLDEKASQPQQVKTWRADDPLAELEAILSRHRAADVAGLPRFVCGAVGYAGYDTVRYVENLPNSPPDDRLVPDMSFAFYNTMVIFDHVKKTILVVALANVCTGDLGATYQAACDRIDGLVQKLQAPSDRLELCDIDTSPRELPPAKSNFSQEDYEAAVSKCKEYITAGDIFQVVLSQRLEVETPAEPIDIYRALRVVNPSPFMFLLKGPRVQLIGSSPEVMVRVEDREVTIRPLAGTRKRGATAAEDQQLEEELLRDEKERAEHVMLIDLARNDVGRVAAFGSVELSDVMVVERYSHVMHITSNVKGRLADGKTMLDALRSGLPAGTVSGAPKVRAMEIIDELEPHRRGPYGGAVGYLDYTGNMDTCIALRTIVMIGNRAYVQAGAGIVADSVPQLEYEETLNKAKGLLLAIEIAGTQLLHGDVEGV